MQNQEVKNRIEQLREQLEKHNYKYYVLSQPSISDFEYDMLMKELVDLEEKFPEYFDENSPSQRVGSDINNEFKQVQHKYPMLSLGNTYSKEELLDFDKRIKKIIDNNFNYVCELKFDGVAIGLTYINGRLTQAVTRGDGFTGDNVTSNVKTIKSIPLIVKGNDIPEEFEIRGEIFMPIEDFKQFNHLRENNGEMPFANPRNATSGTLKTLNSSIVAKRPLDCFLYFIYGDNLPFDSHYKNLHKAREWGFKISENIELCESIEEVFRYIDVWEPKRKDLPFNIDGVVIKVDSNELQQQLGFTAKSPRWAISFKYASEQAKTKLLSVDFQVGRTGAITPVANLSPVHLGGTIVKRASLFNEDQIRLLDLRLHDTVFIEKGGEIIPKIVGIDKSERSKLTKPLMFLEHCPECGTKLIKKEGEAIHYCPNDSGCPPQRKAKLNHFISRKAMNIGGAEATIDILYNKSLVRDISDIYNLKVEDIIELERFGKKSAENLIQSISDSKTIPFQRTLYALGIRFIGETVAKNLASYFNSIDNLKNASYDELINVDEIGERIAESIIAYFKDPENNRVMQKLKDAGVQFHMKEQTEKKMSNILEGKSFVISGLFEKHSREKLKSLIEQFGGINTNSVSSKTSYILAGDKPGTSKLAKAGEFNIPVISESEFLSMINE